MQKSLQPYWNLLVNYLKPQSPRVVLLGVLLLGGTTLQLANPQVIRYFIDTTQSGGSQAGLLLAAGLFITFALVQQGSSLAASYVGQNVAWAATNALRNDLALHCLRLDMSFHKKRTPGEMIARIDGDVTGLANFLSQFALRVLGNALLVIGILVLLFREDWRVGAGLALYTGLMVLVLSALQKIAVKRWAAARQASAEQYGFIEERISGGEDIQAAGAIPYVLYRLYQLMRSVLERYRAAFTVSSIIFNFTNVMSVTGYAIGLALAVYLYQEGQATIGTAYLIVAYVSMLAGPLQHIREQARDLQQAAASIERIHELFRLRPLVRDVTSEREASWVARKGTLDTPRGTRHSSTVTTRPSLPSGPLPVEFEDVSFSYEDRGIVLLGVSFRLRPGRVLGVLGRTGSGKTTLTRLLVRLYDPAQGAIRLDGVDLREIPLANLRARVGMVTQEVQLFQATLRDNLAFFRARIGDEKIERALKSLRLWDWAQSLPEGLDTRLAANGRGLSAGEAQLLAFARVFLTEPGLVILDEASSRLDPATENLLERAIDHLFQNRTGIIIAHRLRTVQRADDILILDNGRVVEHGPREQLAGQPGSRFAGLLKTGLEEVLT